MPLLKLHEREPREQIGAQTGPLYDYQYAQAALDCILLFDDALCVYCEWHDDYVVEHETTAAVVYRFHQVKTRKLTRGPWTLNELFGVNKRCKPQSQPAPTDKPFKYMLENALDFDDQCAGIVFVTNNAVDAEIEALLKDVLAAQSPSDLSAESGKWFACILNGHKKAYPLLDEDALFRVLRRFRVETRNHDPDESESTLLALGARIADVSEVDLFTREATRMGRDIVDLVRTRSGVILKPLPANLSAEALRAQKAILVDDLLKLISLSPQGYKILKQSRDPEAAKHLSRLQRYCKANGIGDDLIARICTLKAAWDVWSIAEQGRVSDTQLLALHSECGNLLTAYAAMAATPNKHLGWFVDQAEDVARRYGHRWNTIQPLGAEQVVGLIFKIATDRGPV
jgi:hypothetical protein